MLLLNDRYDANWRVYLDGKPTALLRANYLMRAVAVPPNEHQVEFRFEPEIRPLYVSLAVCVLAVLLCAALVLVREGEGPPQTGKV